MTTLATPRELDGWSQRPSGLLVREQRKPAPRHKAKPIGISFFAGAGGFDLGFTQAGFHMAAAVEWDFTAACSYLANLGGPNTVVHFNEPDRAPAWEKLLGDERSRWVKAGAPDGFGMAGTGWIAMSDHRACSTGHDGITAPNRCGSCHWGADRCGCARCCDARPADHFWIADVRKLHGREILDALGLQAGDVDAVIGGPPCQGFSMVGKRDVMDPRNSLVMDFARLILEITPKTFVMENVPGMLSMTTPEGIPVVDAFARVLSDGGFAAYDGLRRGLMQQAEAFGGVRTENPSGPKNASAKTTRAARKNEQPVSEEGQLDLFGGADE